MDASEKSIEREGSITRYSVIGSGPPVALGHSLFCQRSMWDGVIERLADQFTFINIGLRGHGESTATASFTLWDVARDWVAILDNEGIERAALCGLSTGGMTAMRLAVNEPSRVCGLAVIDSDAAAESSWFKRLQYSALGGLYRRTGFIPTGTLNRALLGPKATVAMRSELVSAMRGYDRSQLGHAMTAVFGRDSVDVSGLKVPTLVVVGELDHATPPDRSRAIASSIDGARLEVLDGIGHLSAVEDPELLAEVLMPFLASCFSEQATE